MPVTDFNILANETWGPRISPDGTRTYRVTLEAITDSEMTGPDVVGAPGMPIKFGTHADDPIARCISVEAEQDPDDANYWILTYDYSTRVEQFAQAAGDESGGLGGGGETSPEHNDTDPLDRRPKIKLRTKLFKKTIFSSLDGVLIANYAGDPYEGTVIEVPRLVIDITRNLADFDPTLIADTVGAVNVGEWFGYAIRQVKCEELTADTEWDQGVFYWRVHGVFVVANEADLVHSETPGTYWYEWKLNAGYNQLVSGVLRPILIQGQRPSRPQLLTATGAQAAVGATPIYLGFRVLPDASFAALGLID